MNKITEFLARIGLPENTVISPTPDFLSSVQFAAVTHIAYENIDILEGKPLRLDPDALFEKIVTKKRGGYCFEVNGLLSWFFKECGFHVTDYFARYLRGESGIPMRRHRVLSVKCEDGDWFCDIGIGEPAPRLPLPLFDGAACEQFGETYRFDRDPELGWVLSDLYRREWRRFISFTTEKVYEIDFVQPSVWCEMHPDSPFNKVPMIAIKTGDGRKTIDGRVYKVFKDSELVHIEEDISDERYKELLKNEFLLNV